MFHPKSIELSISNSSWLVSMLSIYSDTSRTPVIRSGDGEVAGGSLKHYYYSDWLEVAGLSLQSPGSRRTGCRLGGSNRSKAWDGLGLEVGSSHKALLLGLWYCYVIGVIGRVYSGCWMPIIP